MPQKLMDQGKALSFFQILDLRLVGQRHHLDAETSARSLAPLLEFANVGDCR